MGGGWKRAATALAMLMTLGACRGGEAEDYPAKETERFLATCTRDGTSQAVCRCTLNKTEQKYSIEEYTQEVVQLRQQKASPEFLRDLASFRNECQREQR